MSGQVCSPMAWLYNLGSHYPERAEAERVEMFHHGLLFLRAVFVFLPFLLVFARAMAVDLAMPECIHYWSWPWSIVWLPRSNSNLPRHHGPAEWPHGHWPCVAIPWLVPLLHPMSRPCSGSVWPHGHQGLPALIRQLSLALPWQQPGFLFTQGPLLNTLNDWIYIFCFILWSWLFQVQCFSHFWSD